MATLSVRDERPGVPAVEAADLAGVLGTDQAPVLVDVREPDEFAAWAIPGAHNVPLGHLGHRLAEIPTDRDVVVVCGSGSRSARAVAALRSAGVPAINLSGGMLAWAAVYDTASLDLGEAEVVQLRRRGKGCLSYVVGAAGEAFVVDPSLDTDRYLQVASARTWRITKVFDTHLHADHLSGVRALAGVAGASVHLNPADPFDFPYVPLQDGEWMTLGERTRFGVTVFATPGHTRGSAVFDVAGRALLTGDTLFVDGVGRPDLADHAVEFAHDLYRSLRTKVMTLPSEAVVLPAHYGDAVAVTPGSIVGAPLGELRERVPQLTWTEERFVDWAAGRATPRPPHYVDIIQLNMGAADLTPDLRDLELGPNRCAA